MFGRRKSMKAWRAAALEWKQVAENYKAMYRAERIKNEAATLDRLIYNGGNASTWLDEWDEDLPSHTIN